MRIFWIIIAALAVITGALAWRSGGSDAGATAGSDAGDSLEVGGGAERAAEQAPPLEGRAPSEFDVANQDSSSREMASEPPANGMSEPADDEHRAVESAEPGGAEPGGAAANETSGESADVNIAADEPGADSQPATSAPGESAASEAPELQTGADPGVERTTIERLGEYEVEPSTIVRRDDGSMLLDDQFIVRGSGSKADPYRVTWDLLGSAEEAFAPRQGKLKIPGRVAMLHDKFVKLNGYVAFPLTAAHANEMLSMLNQWDGCCIGVPPSPYDAVEVKLVADATPQQLAMGWGAVTGRLGVDPYLAQDWLLGLYVMTDATLTAE